MDQPSAAHPCAYCGQPIAQNADLCRWCGMQQPPRPGPVDPFAPAPPTPDKPPPPAPAPPPPAPPEPTSPGAYEMREPREWNIAHAHRLRPLTVMQALDGAFKLYRENFLHFAGIMAIVFVPLTIVTMGSIAALVPIQVIAENPNAERDADQLMPMLIGVFAFWGLRIIIEVIAVPLATGALTHAVSERYLSRTATIRESYRVVLRRLFSFLFTAVPIRLAIIVGLSCCIVPGLWLQSLFGFVVQIMVLESLYGGSALARSLQLSDGHRWRLCGMSAAVLFVDAVLRYILLISSQAFAHLFGASPEVQLFVQQAAPEIIAMLLLPLWSVAWVLLYYDVRVRKEAFDLELLLRNPA